MKKYNKIVDKLLYYGFFTHDNDPSESFPYCLMHNNLCRVFDYGSLYYQWGEFWKIINTDNKLFMNEYLNPNHDLFEQAFLRLLVVEEFKTWLKENKR